MLPCVHVAIGDCEVAFLAPVHIINIRHARTEASFLGQRNFVVYNSFYNPTATTTTLLPWPVTWCGGHPVTFRLLHRLLQMTCTLYTDMLRRSGYPLDNIQLTKAMLLLFALP